MKVQSTLDRPLPRSLPAEKAVLGALIDGCRPERVANVLGMLQPRHFTGINQKLYTCVVQMIQEGIPPDLVLITERLELDGEDAAYLAGLIDDAIPASVEHYARIVKQKALLRQNAFLGQQIRDLAIGANGDGAEVLDDIDKILSAHLREEVGQKRILGFKSGSDLAAFTEETIQWIVRGFVARGAITELGAKVKAGKTTFIMALVGAVVDGFNFLGLPTSKTACVYLTEQPTVSFRQAMQRAGVLGRNDFCVLFHNEVRGLKWPEVASAACTECKRLGATLLVVDTLPQFAGLAGDSENNSGDALAAMQPLQQAAADGIGIVLIRHERKSGGDVGDSGRGSSAFAGAADIVLSLRRREGNSRKTVRVLQALSRFSETPSDVVIELTENGYIALGEPQEAALKEAKESLLTSAPKSEAEAAPLKELATSAGVSRVTAQRAVEELLKESILGRIGKGKKGDPFRYFLSENPFCPTSDIYGHKENESQNGEVPYVDIG